MFVLGAQAIINLAVVLSALIAIQIILTVYLLMKLRRLQASEKNSHDELFAKLEKYVRSRKNAGESKHAIKLKLLHAGWPHDAIGKVFKELK